MGLCCWLPLCVHKFIPLLLPFIAWWSLPIFAAVIVLCFVAFIFATSESLPKIVVFDTEKTYRDEEDERRPERREERREEAEHVLPPAEVPLRVEHEALHARLAHASRRGYCTGATWRLFFP